MQHCPSEHLRQGGARSDNGRGWPTRVFPVAANRAHMYCVDTAAVKRICRLWSRGEVGLQVVTCACPVAGHTLRVPSQRELRSDCRRQGRALLGSNAHHGRWEVGDPLPFASLTPPAIPEMNSASWGGTAPGRPLRTAAAQTSLPSLQRHAPRYCAGWRLAGSQLLKRVDI